MQIAAKPFFRSRILAPFLDAPVTPTLIHGINCNAPTSPYFALVADESLDRCAECLDVIDSVI